MSGPAKKPLLGIHASDTITNVLFEKIVSMGLSLDAVAFEAKINITQLGYAVNLQRQLTPDEATRLHAFLESMNQMTESDRSRFYSRKNPVKVVQMAEDLVLRYPTSECPRTERITCLEEINEYLKTQRGQSTKLMTADQFSTLLRNCRKKLVFEKTSKSCTTPSIPRKTPKARKESRPKTTEPIRIPDTPKSPDSPPHQPQKADPPKSSQEPRKTDDWKEVYLVGHSESGIHFDEGYKVSEAVERSVRNARKTVCPYKYTQEIFVGIATTKFPAVKIDGQRIAINFVRRFCSSDLRSLLLPIREIAFNGRDLLIHAAVNGVGCARVESSSNGPSNVSAFLVASSKAVDSCHLHPFGKVLWSSEQFDGSILDLIQRGLSDVQKKPKDVSFWSLHVNGSVLEQVCDTLGVDSEIVECGSNMSAAAILAKNLPELKAGAIGLMASGCGDETAVIIAQKL